MNSNKHKIRVLVVDDSRVARFALRHALGSDDEIVVVGEASDAYEASDKIERFHPDVVTLDLVMPEMDGLTFLRKLMRINPLPVVICSAYSPQGGRIAIEAFSLGAVDIVPKPTDAQDWELLSLELIKKVKAAAATQTALVHKQRPNLFNGSRPYSAHQQPSPPIAKTPLKHDLSDPIIAIGASTGGTVAIEHVLRSFPPDIPPVLIVQHMPPGFTHAYASRLNQVCSFAVEEAVDGMKLHHGLAIVAHGARHLSLVKNDLGEYLVKVKEGPKVNHQCPAVDVLFESIAKNSDLPCIGVILTGLGLDGAKGLQTLRRKGAHTVVQSIRSSVATGMPQAAIQMDAAEVITDIDRIAATILRWIK